MRYIVPTTITDAMLLSCSVPETDHAAWAAGTAYTVGARVIRTSTHSIYERLVAGTTATAPESDAVNWARVGPTNRWAMLDGAVGTTTTASDSISVTLAPGVVVRGLALLDLDVESVRVVMTVGATTVYDSAVDPIGTQEDVDNWFAYYFETIQRRRSLILVDLPPYAEAHITITATASGPVSIGSVVLGSMYDVGTTLAGAQIGIVDYSKKTVDDFGVVSLVERAYAKRMTLPIVLPTVLVDIVTLRLARIRAKPVVWIGSERIDSLIVYGWCKDWSVDIPGQTLSTCSLQIEGLV